MSAASIRDALTRQAGWCRALDAPATARLCEAAAACVGDGTPVGQRLADWPGDPDIDALPMRVTGALHAGVRAGRFPALAALLPPNPSGDPGPVAATARAALADAAWVMPWLDGPPQTNEVGRAAVLMAGLLAAVEATGVAKVALFELGASAGLNLRLDSYRHDLGGVCVGPADATVKLAPEWGGPPPPTPAFTVTARVGVDLNPLDVTDAADAARLLAYIWVDQRERLARAAAAIVATAAEPPPLIRDDAAAWLTRTLAAAGEPGVLRVVMHSVAMQYFPAATRSAVLAHLDTVGAQATADTPLAHLSYEFEVGGEAAFLRLRTWPGGESRLLARAHPHGAAVAWMG